MPDKLSRKSRVFSLLKDRRYHTARELAKVGGFRYGARLRELRSDGCAITTKRDATRPGLFLYRLVSKPAQ